MGQSNRQSKKPGKEETEKEDSCGYNDVKDCNVYAKEPKDHVHAWGLDTCSETSWENPRHLSPTDLWFLYQQEVKAKAEV